MESNREDGDGFPGSMNRERSVERFAGFPCKRSTSLQRSPSSKTAAPRVPSRTFRVRHPVTGTVPSSLK